MDVSLIYRVTVGIVAIPVILVLTRWGGVPFLVFVDLVILVGIYEWLGMARSKGIQANAPLSFGLALLISWDYFFRAGADAHLFLVLSVLLTLTWELWRKDKGSALLNVGTTLVVVMYVGGLGGMLILLRQCPTRAALLPPGHLMIFVFILVWSSDTFAYFIGRWIGKHRLFPRVSPKKSIEGAIGGLVGALLVAWVCGTTFMKGLFLPHLLMIGALAGVGGQIGDLAESLIKRDVGVKDASHILPGHGGVLDRFDSLFFVAPLVYFYAKYTNIL